MEEKSLVQSKHILKGLIKALRKGYFPGEIGRFVAPGIVMVKAYLDGVDAEIAKLKAKPKAEEKPADVPEAEEGE